MPFPSNWLEELVVEWLELEGFTISTSVSVPAGPGGKWVPDVVGARLKDGHLLIRHCEATGWFTQGPEPTAKKYREKFSSKVQEAVREHFAPIFGHDAAKQATYEMWVITCSVSRPVGKALEEAVPGINVRTFKGFVHEQVLPTIRGWKRKPSWMLPSDKWLLLQIDMFNRFKMITPSDARTPLAVSAEVLVKEDT